MPIEFFNKSDILLSYSHSAIHSFTYVINCQQGDFSCS